ncbi:MAG: ABC transporter permease, partial [Acidobacteriota bacterium]
VSVDDFLDWREQSQSFEYLVAATQRDFNFVGTGEPVRIRAFRFTPGFFPMTGYELALGRSFRVEEGDLGADRVTVLSHSFWQQQFGGSRDVLGKSVSLDGESYTVVGVAAEDFFFPTRRAALWTPLVLERGRSSRDDRSLLVMGRLRPRISAEEATAEMQTIARRLEATFPETNEGWTATVITVRDDLVSDVSLAVTLLYGSTTFVLLIACANVANLLLARATVREKEIALRTTLGASRLRLMRQLLTESVVLSSVGGALGLVLGSWGMNVLRTLIAPDPNVGFIAEAMQLNGWILGHTLAISLLAGVVFGLAPALQGSKLNLQETLKEGARGGGVRRRYVRRALVVAEVAMALVLLGTAGALIRAFNHLYTVDPGFNPKNLLTLHVALAEADYSEPQQMVAFYRESLERLARIPGVESAAITTTLPLTLFPGRATTHVTVEGLPEEEGKQRPEVIDLVVSPSYFETMEIPIERGRGLTEQDNESSLRVAVVSKAMVRRYWPETDPLGKRFHLGDQSSDSPWFTVVGVADDVQTNACCLGEPEGDLGNRSEPAGGQRSDD